MRLYEWEAKELLAERGVPVPASGLAGSVRQVGSLASQWDGAALKAQVLHGGRMKAGLIRFAAGLDDAEAAAVALLAPGEGARVLVEQRLEIESEAFVGVLYDPRLRSPVFLYTPHGGIDVESESAGSILRLPLDAGSPVHEHVVRTGLRRAGVASADLRPLTAIATALARAFFELDATLVEINPLARLRDGRWVALDAHVELDGDALPRQRDLVERFELGGRSDDGRTPTAAEQEASAIDAIDHRGVAGRLVEFDGDLGLIIGGGGASLTVFDAVRDAGGRPANYCEVGGNPSVAKVTAFTRLLLERMRPSRLAVVMNVVSNTRADLVARGVIEGCLEAGRLPKETIAVFRVPGAWEQESRELLDHYGVPAIGREVGVDAAARLAVGAER